MTTHCDINTCEDCPRYGDDCDGDKRVERTDYISRADAIERSSAVTHDLRTETHGVCLIIKDDAIETVCRTRCGDKAKGCPAHSCLVIEEFDALPSAEAEQTVIRSRTLMPTKDFAEEKGYCHRIIPSNVEVVVRCKDCKHYIVEGITTQYGWCHGYKHSVNEDDYCSYGERKK